MVAGFKTYQLVFKADVTSMLFAELLIQASALDILASWRAASVILTEDVALQNLFLALKARSEMAKTLMLCTKT